MSHGGTSSVDPTVWLGDDPALALVTADMGEWSAAHPCECEALCECDEAVPASETCERCKGRKTITYFPPRRDGAYPIPCPDCVPASEEESRG